MTTSLLLTQQQQLNLSCGFLAVHPQWFIDFLWPFHGLLLTGTYCAPHGGWTRTDTEETITTVLLETDRIKKIERDRTMNDRVQTILMSGHSAIIGGVALPWLRFTICNSRREVNNVVITVRYVPHKRSPDIPIRWHVHSPWPPPSFWCFGVGRHGTIILWRQNYITILAVL